MKCNTYEINEMIDILEEFFNSGHGSNNVITIGGMIGSFVFKYAIDAATMAYPFNKVLVVEGCQDYIGISKTYIPNFIYYADLFVDSLHDPLTQYNPFKPTILNPKPCHCTEIRSSAFNYYDAMIINDAHLIPDKYLISIKNNFMGKICIVADPFDVGGDKYSMAPTVTDSMYKLSPITAMARKSYGVDTRFIDKTIKGIVNEANINKRSVGKIDDKQYVTNDEYLIDTIRHKQLQSSFRKNQKLLVISEIVNTNIDENKRSHSLVKNSMCVIASSNFKPFMKLRIYNSKTVFSGDVSYIQNDVLDNVITVKPANILSIDESIYHRYNHTVLIDTNDDIPQKQKYSILKNSNNLTIAHMK